MQRYDEDYRNLVSKLNSAYEQSRNNAPAYMAAFGRMNADNRELIEGMSAEEVRKIGAKIRANVTDISYLTKDEKNLLNEIKKGKKTKYRQAVCRLTGKINTEQIMQNYTEYMWDEPALRTVYLYKGLQEPVRVVCENRECVFSIHDIKNLNQAGQTYLLKNVVAAETRREFNIETDSVLRIQGYITDENEITVVVSIYPDIPYSMGVRGILMKVFRGMTPQGTKVSVVNEAAVQKINEELKAQSLTYWKNLLLPLGKSMTIPGEKYRKDEFGHEMKREAFLYKELDEETASNLIGFCEKYLVSVKSVFLYAWGSMMGRLHNEKKPLMLVAQSGENLNLFPVKVERDIEQEGGLHNIDDQLAAFPNYNKCSVQEIEREVGITFWEYFRMVHNFMEFNELDDVGNGKRDITSINGMTADDTDINLFISYHLYDNNIGISYISKGNIIELVLDNLHELFVEELNLILSHKSLKFDKNSFIKVTDTDEEKMYKIQLAQIALYLKESGIFESVSVDEIMKLAEHCRLVPYLSNDVVVAQKSSISRLYILGDGKMEESTTAADGMVKSLRIIKKGSIFGIESLFPEGEAGTEYTVVSPVAKVVEIDKDILTEVFRRKPEGWIALLKNENEQKSRLQRLWTMV